VGKNGFESYLAAVISGKAWVCFLAWRLAIINSVPVNSDYFDIRMVKIIVIVDEICILLLSH
jgi:hypothetical protein